MVHCRGKIRENGGKSGKYIIQKTIHNDSLRYIDSPRYLAQFNDTTVKTREEQTEVKRQLSNGTLQGKIKENGGNLGNR